MELKVTKKFVKSYDKSDDYIQMKIDSTLSLFAEEPFHRLLHNHPLKGTMQGWRTINVTGDYRIIFRELSDGSYELVELIDIGTHSQLYG